MAKRKSTTEILQRMDEDEAKSKELKKIHEERKHLKPKQKPRILIGFYEDINGKNAVPLDNVKPTKAEIFAIIRYHAELMRSVDEMFAMGQSGSWEIRQLPYSNMRIKYYSQFVDKEEIDKIFDEVYKGFKTKEE